MSRTNPFPIIPTMVLCAVVPIIVLTIVYHVRRMRRAWNSNHLGSCACGYPIGGLKVDQCPECGKVHEAISQRMVRQRTEMVGFLFSSAFLLWIASKMTISVVTWLVPPVMVNPQVLALGSAVGDLEVRWNVVLSDQGLGVDEVTITRSPLPGAPAASPLTVTIVAEDPTKADDSKSAARLGDTLAPIVDSAAGLSFDERLKLGVNLVSVTTLALSGAHAERVAAMCRRSQNFSPVQSSSLPLRRISRFPNWTVYTVASLAWVEIARRAARRFWVKSVDQPATA